jgi:hypothetical protein
MPDAGARQACAYALGRASELYPSGFAPYALSVLQALGACVAKGECPGELRGECTDNAVTSVGVILERIVAGNGANGVGTTGINFEFMWGQWLDYLPLKHDLVRVIELSVCLYSFLCCCSFICIVHLEEY